MRSNRILLAAALALVLTAGCAGPEQKLGRGLNNLMEFPRGGELRRSMEQTALFYSPDRAYGAGFLHGINQSFVRTIVGAYEVATFPFPGYEPYLTPTDPVYQDNYKPGLIEDSMFFTDHALGFEGGDVAPFFMNSRFRIFDR